MKILNLAVISMLLMCTACCTSGKTTKEASSNESMDTTKMMEAGYTMGTVVASTAENDCPYVLKSTIDGNDIMFDPINLEETYKKDGMTVWYKYTGLRMMNRCEKANPIRLEEIQKAK
ncbi:MAG: hypothetical protein R3359_00880 [Marinirhabdus sp.]|nr:hypothetical protein [Marinirhabdus sp.]